MERKLAAIFSADVQGYSRLMGEDEEATVRTLTAYREVMTSLICQHRGRVVDSPGDNLLAEFSSVVDAVQCAVIIQQEFTAQYAGVPDNRKMVFRIGINLGDVLVEGERLYGDGVNIAARLESLAEGGGLCISGTVYDQVENKLALRYVSLGEQWVKNITKPVRVYQVQMDSKADHADAHPAKAHARHAFGDQHQRVSPLGSGWWWWAIVATTVFLVLGITGIRLWHNARRDSASRSVAISQVPIAPMRLDAPSIAVLPFRNLSNDAEQEYFADGMTDDLITDLSKISSLAVIARSAVFTYKGQEVAAQQVAEELGVRYVLEGSIRRAGDAMRINVQLTDATTGGVLNDLW